MWVGVTKQNAYTDLLLHKKGEGGRPGSGEDKRHIWRSMGEGPPLGGDLYSMTQGKNQDDFQIQLFLRPS